MKISLDVEELKRSLMASAITAKNQLTEMAKQAQVQEKLDSAINRVMTSELLKNPKVSQLAKRLAEVSVQWEKVLSQVKAKVNGMAAGSATRKKSGGKKKAAKKAETEEKVTH